MNTSHAEYFRIIFKMQQAREAGNQRMVKVWRTKLEKWQKAYGAYAPIGRGEC